MFLKGSLIISLKLECEFSLVRDEEGSLTLSFDNKEVQTSINVVATASEQEVIWSDENLGRDTGGTEEPTQRRH